ncbi:lantibiotic dehydratase [Spirosoma sp.]|uniref:lantibiotic dehydratase n=1 Tax=Spirosoma sp. TaxID=1899569 RepID=UPI0026122A71|nr:lantibiotic dehydratase [Spirosoma sp.]MCX6212979.1 lantibiotic dehydratase [Spirosoma sp.]
MIKHSDFFVLRRPLYPISTLAELYTQLAKQPLEKLLQTFYADPLPQQAIYLSSSSLHQRLQDWLAGKTIPEKDKLLVTLHKYAIRMCTRSTPFGLLAGCAVGSFGVSTQLQPGSINSVSTNTRLDIDCLFGIRDNLIQQTELRSHLNVFPNSSLYQIGSSYRYIERQRDSTEQHYYISAVEGDIYLDHLLLVARSGLTFGQLTGELVAMGIEESEAIGYLEQIIDSQLLTFDIDPAITGSNLVGELINRFDTISGSAIYVDPLKELESLLKEPGSIQVYDQIQHWFTEQYPSLKITNLIQVDSFYKSDTIQLGDRLIKKIQQSIEKLLALNNPRQNVHLDEFKRRFYNRYEDEEVPLAHVLDQEFGIGYGQNSVMGIGYAPLVDDLSLPVKETSPVAVWDWWQSLVMDKYAATLRTNKMEITLTDADLSYIHSRKGPPNSLPSSFFVFGSLLANSAKEIDEGTYLFYLHACQGPSAFNLISRFGEGHPELANSIQKGIIREEEYQEHIVLAEVIHLPEDRAGNILTRPVMYTYEIPYLGKSSVEPANQLLVTDLMVSIRNNRIILRSRRLNKRVVPRLTNAHNWRLGLPIYQFLCDLQQQDSQLNLSWNWGVLAEQEFLPRVTYQNIIISRATWQLRCDLLNEANPLRLVAQLTALRIPDQFVIAQGDNELLISMHIPESLDLLIREIRKHKTLKIIEFLATDSLCPLGIKKERYTHELIIPFRNDSVSPLPGLVTNTYQPPTQRFSVGSEWLYLKIYTGEKMSDSLLTQFLYPTIQHLFEKNIIEAFFFIRYADPDPHLRLRFRGNPHLGFYSHVIKMMESALQVPIHNGVVHRIQADTYQREIERYGAAHIVLCESIFHADSLITLSFLTQTGNSVNEDLRFLFAIRKIDTYLNGVNMSIDERSILMNQLKDNFFNEFEGTTLLRRQINVKYRQYQSLIQQSFDETFTNWGNQNEESFLITQLYELSNQVSDMTTLCSLLTSLIHMAINRVFPSKQRIYELVIYHCLAKLYDSKRARQTD